LAVHALRTDGGFRKLDDILWALWCYGFPVTEGVRRSLMKSLASHEGMLRSELDALDDDTAAARSAERLTSGRLAWPWNAVRKRVKRGKMETVRGMVADAALGEFDVRVKYDEAREADFTAAAQAIGAVLGEPHTPASGAHDALRDAIRIVSGEFNLPRLRAVLAETDAPWLEQLRDEARTMFGILALTCFPPPYRDTLLTREAFLVWFAVRYASPLTAGPVYERLQQPDVPPPEPTMLQRLAGEASEASQRARRRRARAQARRGARR
jgi:hypothetical protein